MPFLRFGKLTEQHPITTCLALLINLLQKCSIWNILSVFSLCVFPNLQLRRDNTVFPEPPKLPHSVHVFIHHYAKSEYNEGTIPTDIKPGRLLDVRITLHVFLFKPVSLRIQCDVMMQHQWALLNVKLSKAPTISRICLKINYIRIIKRPICYKNLRTKFSFVCFHFFDMVEQDSGHFIN